MGGSRGNTSEDLNQMVIDCFDITNKKIDLMGGTHQNIVISFDPVMLGRIDRVIDLLTQAINKENIIMATLDDIIAKVSQETTDIGSLQVFVQGLEDQIKALPGITPAQQAQIDVIFADVDKNDVAIVNAMKAPATP